MKLATILRRFYQLSRATVRAVRLVFLFSIFSFMFGCALGDPFIPGGPIAVDQMNVKSTLLTAGVKDKKGNLIAQEKFHQGHISLFFQHGDEIFFSAVIEWPYPEKPAGAHDIIWNWYNNKNEIVKVKKRRYAFTKSPFELWAAYPAYILGAGENKVEIYIDGKLMASKTFSVE